MVAGRVGAAMAAEIGTMRVTEQIDALATLSTNPMKYLSGTPHHRWRANAATAGAGWRYHWRDGRIPGRRISAGLQPLRLYVQQTWAFVETLDVMSGLVKAAVFGFIVTLMGCYHGYNSRGGAQGVGIATTNAVVSSAILILVANYVLTESFFSK